MNNCFDQLDARERQYRIPGPIENLQLFLRHLPAPEARSRPKPVLFIHGMSFPSALSVAHRFDGRSWRDELCDAGFDVWALDFYGFGFSDRYREMNEEAALNPPLGRAEEASRQIEAAVRFICEHHRWPRLHVIAHSAGTIPVGRFAARCPELIDRIVFFAPIARREPVSLAPSPPLPAWRTVSLKAQWDRFQKDVPPGEEPVLSPAHFADWGSRYLDTDAESHTRSPASVKIPTGMAAEIASAENGSLCYEPSDIRAPVAIIRGEWDSVCTDADAAWLFESLSASPGKRDVKIAKATHLMHLEQNRFALYRETQTFLEGDGNTMHEVENEVTPIPGYDYGTARVGRSPVSLEELRQIEMSAGWSDEDAQVLQRYGHIFKSQAENMVDAWRAVIGAQPHLAKWFFGPGGQPDNDYKARVKARFVQWVADAAFRPHDQAWLDYQEEIGLRHTPAKKNQTDGTDTPSVVPLRYLLAFVTTVTAISRKFFVDNHVAGEELRKLEEAWAKAVQLHITFWARPYTREGLW